MNTRQTLLSLGFVVVTLALIPKTAHAGTCFVWRVTSTPVPCYLVGTLNALRAQDYPLPAGYDQALRDFAAAGF